MRVVTSVAAEGCGNGRPTTGDSQRTASGDWRCRAEVGRGFHTDGLCAGGSRAAPSLVRSGPGAAPSTPDRGRCVHDHRHAVPVGRSDGSDLADGRRHLLPGDPPRRREAINPLLAFDGSLTTTAQIVIQILRDPRTAKEIGIAPGSNDTYDVNNGTFGGSGPFVAVVATTDSAAGATDLTDRVMNRAIQELEDRQLAAGAPESTLIGSQILVRPTEAEPLIGGKVRFAGAALMLGIIVALAAPFAVESRIQSKKRFGRPAEPLPPVGRGADLPPVPQQMAPYPTVDPQLVPPPPRYAPVEMPPDESVQRRRRPVLRQHPGQGSTDKGTRPSPSPVSNGSRPSGGPRTTGDSDPA